MLDLTIQSTRFMDVKIGDKSLSLQPPKVKTIRKMLNISKGLVEGDASGQIEELIGIIAKILSQNTKVVKITPEEVEENLDFDSMIMLLEKYFAWISEIRADPN